MPKGQGVRPKKSEQMSFHPDAGDNRKFLQHKRNLMNLPKVDIHEPEAVKKRVDEYFDICEAYDIKPSVESLAVAFMVDRRTIWRWSNGIDCRGLPAESMEAIRKAHTIITSLMADYMQNGKINPVSGIFLMKNNMDYEDKREVTLRPENPMGDQVAPEDLQKRYLDAVETPDELPEKNTERQE